MDLKLANWLRVRTANYFAYRPNRASRALFRSTLMLALLVARAPWSVVRELALGRNSVALDLKTAARAALWVWNRSWLPLKIEVGTFFDISLVLSEGSCRTLRERGFVGRDRLRRISDYAQYELSTLKAHLDKKDGNGTLASDRELCRLVDEILHSADRGVAERPDVISRPNETSGTVQASPRTGSAGFHNERTRTALMDFDRLCAEVGQEYFLVSGTFLGAVRDGAFIGHDHDIDLGIFEGSLNAAFLSALRGSGTFVVTRVEFATLREAGASGVEYEKMEKPVLIRLVHKSGVAIDVFIHFCDGESTWHGTSAQRWDNRRFTLAGFDFLGHAFKGAADFDRYLTENYGRDWRVPKTGFDSNFDTPNIGFMHTANGLVFCAWALAKSMAERRPDRLRQFVEILRSGNVIEPWNGTSRVRRGVMSND
jgi:hypothetical protein